MEAIKNGYSNYNMFVAHAIISLLHVHEKLDTQFLIPPIKRHKHGLSSIYITRKTNSAVCSLATVASRAQSVRASNCHTLAASNRRVISPVAPLSRQSLAVRCTHTLGAWRHCRERANCRVRFRVGVVRSHKIVRYFISFLISFIFLWFLSLLNIWFNFIN